MNATANVLLMGSCTQVPLGRAEGCKKEECLRYVKRSLANTLLLKKYFTFLVASDPKLP